MSGRWQSATPHPYSAAALAEAGEVRRVTPALPNDEATREYELASAWGTTVFSDEAWEANVRARRRYADEYPYRYTVEYSDAFRAAMDFQDRAYYIARHADNSEAALANLLKEVGDGKPGLAGSSRA